MIILHLSAEETCIGFELQWNAKTEPLKDGNSSDSCTNFVALVSFFQMYVRLFKKKTVFDY